MNWSEEDMAEAREELQGAIDVLALSFPIHASTSEREAWFRWLRSLLEMRAQKMQATGSA